MPYSLISRFWAACLTALLLTAPAALRALPVRPGGDKLVHDDAHVLRPETALRLEQQLEHYADSTGVQLAVVTWPSLHGLEVAQVADSIKNAWGVGSKVTRRGLLYLIAPNERRQTIRTGRGLEADLPDALCFRILKQTQPGMGQDMETAILNRVAAIQQQLATAGAPPYVEPVSSAPRVFQPEEFWFGLLLIGAGLAIMALARLAAGKQRKKMAPDSSHRVIAPGYSQPIQPGSSPAQANRTQDANDPLTAWFLSSSKKRKKDDSDGTFGGWDNNDGGSSTSEADFSFGGDANAGGGGASEGW